MVWARYLAVVTPIWLLERLSVVSVYVKNEHMTKGFNETKTLTLLFFKAAIKY
jgi:hypothetical protein